MNILCIDYGKVHHGIAVATSLIADPIETVHTSELEVKIKALVAEYKVEVIVIGISEQKSAEASIKLGKYLAKEKGLPVYGHDETLSSKDTRRKLAAKGMKKSKREAKIDHFVAATILQDFLDTYPDLEDVPEDARLFVF